MQPLRIAHVLPYISADGAFGGPVAVAVEQCRELARQGHHVALVAGWDGKASLSIDRVDVRLFRARPLPGLGFSGLLSPALIRALTDHVREFDVVHIHLGRHLLALAAADICRRAGVPFVLQTHGMVIEDTRAKSRVLDALAVRRVLRGALAVLALTDTEEIALRAVSGGTAPVKRIRNGVGSTPVSRARTRPSVPEVLFLARLHPRKRVLAFAEMARLLAATGVRARFSVVGPDEGDLSGLREYIELHPEVPLSYEGSIEPGASQGRLARAQVFVLPSVGEVFPMTVLESLAAGTPVVLTDDCGIADELDREGAALITSGTPAALAEAVQSILLSDAVRERLEQGMRTSLKRTFGIEPVATALGRLYRGAER
jgi:glycosyltransferase involved in cell wall biosynthesis